MTEAAATHPPRIFGITAADADVAAIIRRGPSDWFHVGKWDTLSGSYTPGSWFHGLLYPQRCDVSPDGKLFCYLALHPSRWPAGDTYIAISKLPWLTALAAWPTFGTYSQGAYFVRNASAAGLGPPIVGDLSGLAYGIVESSPHSFAVERRRGWTERPDTPKRLSMDMWDVKRDVHMMKPNPLLPDVTLRVRGAYAAFRSGSPSTAEIEYEIHAGGEARPLIAVQWAEWDARGRLLLATIYGDLRIVDVQHDFDVVAEVSLRDLPRNPSPPPSEAASW